MKESVLSVKEFHKSYGESIAVAGISFEVQQGEIFGLLGPNGAGKTTTLECLEGIRMPDRGQMRILGVDPSREPGKLRNLIGVQLQTSGLPPNMTVAEAMRFFCAYHGVAARFDLLDRLGLKDKYKSQFQQLSTGLQRRLALALAIAHKPPVIILDEPTAGLDVDSRNQLHILMQELQGEGISILLATHDMAEAEKMTNRGSDLAKRQARRHRLPPRAHSHWLRFYQGLCANRAICLTREWYPLSSRRKEGLQRGLRSLLQHRSRSNRVCSDRVCKCPRRPPGGFAG
jgi:ABC-2 type transport system ATP-binding protein